MSFSQSQTKAPHHFQNGFYTKRNEKGELVIAGTTAWSEQYGLEVGQLVGQIPKHIPVYEEPEQR